MRVQAEESPLGPDPAVGLLLVLAGPAGSGKTTLCERLIRQYHPGLQRVVTATSRPPRPGEVDGQDYYFLSLSDFEAAIAEEAFYEHAMVHGLFRYGALKRELQAKLARRIDLVMNVDVQGAAAYRQAAQTDAALRGRLVTVFIMPRDLAQIRHRLLARDPGRETEIERRLQTALEEVTRWPEFDYCFTSDTREADFERVRAIYEAEKARVCRLRDRQG